MRLHATELMMLLGAAILMLVERPAEPQVEAGVGTLSLEQAELVHNR